jgi:hypothetical protein
VLYELRSSGYNIIFVHEKFGVQSNIREKNPGILEHIIKEYNTKNYVVFSPYRSNFLNSEQHTGDIIYDFSNSISNLFRLEKTGPLINIISIQNAK